MTVLLGFLIGATVGLTGVGAGSLTVGVLILLLGESPAAAVGTALVFTVAVKIAVVPIYVRRRQVDGSTLGAMCAGGIPGALIGVAALEYLNVRRYESAIVLSVGVIITAMAIYNLYRLLRPARGVSRTRPSAVLPWIAALIGAETGFSSAGAGALGSVVLLSLTALTPVQVVGTDLTFGLIVSAIGGGWHFAAGSYSASLLTGLIPGGLAGVLAGAKLGTLLPARALRAVLSAVLCGLGIQLCWKACS